MEVSDASRAFTLAHFPVEILAQITSLLPASIVLGTMSQHGNRTLTYKLEHGGVVSLFSQGFYANGVNFLAAQRLKGLTAFELIDSTEFFLVGVKTSLHLPTSITKLRFGEKTSRQMLHEISNRSTASEPDGPRLLPLPLKELFPNLLDLHCEPSSMLTSDYHLKLFLKSLPASLKRLSARGSNTRMSQECWELLPPHLEVLVGLEIDFPFVSASIPFAAASTLIKVLLNHRSAHPPGAASNELHAAMKFLPAVQDITLQTRHIEQVSFVGVRELHTLSIEGGGNEAMSLQTVLERIPRSLTSLTIAYAPVHVNDDLVSFPPMVNLTELHLWTSTVFSRNAPNDGSFLNNIFVACPNLRSFALEGLAHSVHTVSLAHFKPGWSVNRSTKLRRLEGYFHPSFFAPTTDATHLDTLADLDSITHLKMAACAGQLKPVQFTFNPSLPTADNPDFCMSINDLVRLPNRLNVLHIGDLRLDLPSSAPSSTNTAADVAATTPRTTYKYHSQESLVFDCPLVELIPLAPSECSDGKRRFSEVVLRPLPSKTSRVCFSGSIEQYESLFNSLPSTLTALEMNIILQRFERRQANPLFVASRLPHLKSLKTKSFPMHGLKDFVSLEHLSCGDASNLEIARLPPSLTFLSHIKLSSRSRFEVFEALPRLQTVHIGLSDIDGRFLHDIYTVRKLSVKIVGGGCHSIGNPNHALTAAKVPRDDIPEKNKADFFWNTLVKAYPLWVDGTRMESFDTQLA